ncbi:hypothetical protein IRZ59_20385 [Pseudomonas guariconensis]|uniref:hypothetical protein n=1 Tax=Pseudomonas guariconensis TaxID=1288410 RepID=UPI0018A91539|nr:hypothetical protein [Pseudomonas guariconensis]MBF8732797.1 hypothetical protein [Pseudomonas guariconensis]
MKRLALVALAGLVLAGGGQKVLAVTINDSTDRFSGVRTISWEPIPSRAEEFVLTSSLYKGKEAKVSRLSVELLTYGHSQQYESCNHVYWLADGIPVDGIPTDYSAEFASGVVIERFKLKPADGALDKLASAKKVEFKVCNTEGIVSDNDLSGFKAVFAKTSD